METKLLTTSAKDIAIAAGLIRQGGIVAMPTETVYGLAADALNGEAVKKIFAAKGRPADNPLIVHIADLSQIGELTDDFPEKARFLAEAFWPGPLTMILPRSSRVPPIVSAGLPTVAIRFPSHPAAQRLIRESCPLAAPSANLSGSPSPTTFRHVREDMMGRADAIIDGGDCAVGVESTVITLLSDPPRLLRPGGITAEQLRDVIGPVTVDEAVCRPLREGEAPASPGMKYKHYAPCAQVILLQGGEDDFVAYVNAHAGDGVGALCDSEETARLQVPCMALGPAEDLEKQAHELFAALRGADERGWKTVYAHCPPQTGVGLAVYNRMVRAAGFCVIPLGKEEVV